MVRVSINNFPPTLTKQSLRDECNINSIVARYKKTGVISHQSARKPQYMDTTVVAKSYEQAFDIVRQADEAFMSLPAEVRKTFGNSPARFCDFACDPSNIEQMRKWGLAPAADQPVEAAPHLDQ